VNVHGPHVTPRASHQETHIEAEQTVTDKPVGGPHAIAHRSSVTTTVEATGTSTRTVQRRSTTPKTDRQRSNPLQQLPGTTRRGQGQRGRVAVAPPRTVCTGPVPLEDAA